MIGVAIVGAGNIGRVRAQSILRSDEARVAWVGDVDANRGQSLAALSSASSATGWREVVAKPEVDVVVVSTPTKFHAEIAIEALRHGKHVLCEKPLARTAEEAWEVVAAARHANRVLKTGFNYRQMDHVRKARELLANQAIGPVHFLRCRYGHGGKPHYEQDWCTDGELSGGGVLQEQGIHMVDLARVLLGEPVRVCAETRRYFWNFRDTEDNCFCLLETAEGQLASLHVSWTQWKNILEVEVFGRDGYLRLEGRDGHYGPQRLTWGKRQPDHGRPIEEVFTFGPSPTSWDREWREFVELLHHGSDSFEAAWQGWRTQALVDLAYKSAREHAWVEVPPFRAGQAT